MTIPLSIFSQTLKRTYYDFHKTRINEEAYVNAKGELNGPYKSYDQSGIINLTCNYKNGELDGFRTEYTTYSGKQKIVSKIFYKKNLMNGEGTKYFGNGLPSQHGFYKDDKKEGKWTFYDVSGRLASEGTYKDDMKEGNWAFISPYENNLFTKEQLKGFEFIKSFSKFHEDKDLLDGSEDYFYFPSGKIYQKNKSIEDRKSAICFFPTGTRYYEDSLVNKYYVYKKEYFLSGKVKSYETWVEGKRREFTGEDADTNATLFQEFLSSIKKEEEALKK
jgi:antitoxin component YwqK of YwqJK toxin-antitoxin module